MVAKTILSKYEIERDKPMPSFNHGVIQTNIIIALAAYKKEYTIASELKFKLPPDEWESVPDVAILQKTAPDFKNDIIAYPKPPLATIEILSPTQSLTTLTSKAEEYFQHGVQSCWIVIPEFKNIYVYSTPDKYEIFKSTDLLKDAKLDISFPLKEVFE
ncbi:MAG: Uma2 family endonuclease [Bacteroidota bacterium]